MKGSPAYYHMQKRATQAADFMMMYADRVPLSEIALQLNLPVDTVKYWAKVYVLAEDRRKKPRRK